MSRKKNKNKKRRALSLQQRIELRMEEVASIVERSKPALSVEDHAKLKTAMDMLTFLTEELQKKQTSLERLRRLLFGATTEKTRAVLGEDSSPDALVAHSSAGESKSDRPRPPGHGRNSAAAYTGADKVVVPHPSVHGGEACPACEQGRIYALAEPSVWVRISGVAPLGATVYECDRLRCNLCGEVYTATAPEGVGTEKYDATATSMIGLLKYGTGLPFNRIEKLQEAMRIPLPAATQWDLVKEAAQKLAPVHEELIRTAAQGE
jgi:transposase